VYRVAESFFKPSKTEFVYHQKYNIINEDKLSVFEYVEIWYYRQILHSLLRYLTPYEFEIKYQ